ncbi:MAG: Gfo/Idh/MocA family oxidoreductase [Planctomycetaceae bacterium]|nr:Gfo/Idh/MocA family oxidoreductase [Planctomycetaceae bacterium]
MPRLTASRRTFLAGSAAAVTVPYFAWQPRTLAAETRSPTDRIALGLIGAGGISRANLNAAKKWIDVVAIADVDAGRREEVNQLFADGKAAVFDDYRKILERKDVDVIHVATPDHWHTKPVVEAMLAGKDIYCEKPLTLTIDEGKLIRRVQKETGRIVQVGTQQRSTFHLFVKALALVAEGRLGKINRIEARIGEGPQSPAIPVAPPPANLDWDRWLGPAAATDYRFMVENGGVDAEGKPRKPQNKTNGHYEFRWWYEYSGGKLTDWGAHHVDIATWALALNGQTGGPLAINGTAKHELVDHPLPEDALAKVYASSLPLLENERSAHWANFLLCTINRRPPISDVHSHMKMLNICHLAGISARLGRGLKWDDAAERIVGDDQANAMLARPYRKGYEIEMG